jgi:hypothetical protein
MLVAAGRFDRPAHLMNDNLARLAGHRLRHRTARLTHSQGARGSYRECRHRSPVDKQSALQSSAAPTCLVSCCFCDAPKSLSRQLPILGGQPPISADSGQTGQFKRFISSKENSWQKRERIQMTVAGAEFLNLQGQNMSEISWRSRLATKNRRRT